MLDGNISISLGNHLNIYIIIYIVVIYPSYWELILISIYIYVCISMFGYYIHLIGESFLYMYIDVLNISILLGNHVNIAG